MNKINKKNKMRKNILLQKKSQSSHKIVDEAPKKSTKSELKCTGCPGNRAN